MGRMVTYCFCFYIIGILLFSSLLSLFVFQAVFPWAALEMKTSSVDQANVELT